MIYDNSSNRIFTAFGCPSIEASDEDELLLVESALEILQQLGAEQLRSCEKFRSSREIEVKIKKYTGYILAVYWMYQSV